MASWHDLGNSICWPLLDATDFSKIEERADHLRSGKRSVLVTGCALFPVRRSSTSVEVNFYDLSYVKAAKHYRYGGQHVNTVPSGGNSAKYGAYLGRVFQITPRYLSSTLCPAQFVGVALSREHPGMNTEMNP